jgi:hypothetical protein
VYLEESLLVNPGNVSGTLTVAAFVGVAEKGQINEPVLIDSWNSYVTLFGGFDPITPPVADDIDTKVLSYLPYAVYSFFQNGGRFAYIIRAASTLDADKGLAADMVVNGMDTVAAGSTLESFTIKAKSVGTWGNTLKYALVKQRDVGTTAPNIERVFALQVYLKTGQGTSDSAWEVVESFTNLSVLGTAPGSRQVTSAINDQFAGSRYITISGLNSTQPRPAEAATPVALDGGIDPKIPDDSALIASCSAITKVEGPVSLNICGYLKDASKMDTDPTLNYVSAVVSPGSFNREDIMVINDSAMPAVPGADSGLYATSIATPLGQPPEDPYVASYAPWIIVPDPRRTGAVIAIPPGGAILGMMSRIDATIGVFRAPAGVVAGLANAVGVQVKFTDSQLGDLNAQNINVIRPVVGSGICCMGGRTRRTYGADRYVSARRTLISIKESLRRSTQWAVFENNDQRLWSGLRMTADRILRPMWESGGLAGNSAAEAYFIRCDESINTPAVIQSGEVRMEVGLALEYPAEFVVIRITQVDRGSISSDANL